MEWNGKGNALADLGRLDEALEAYETCSRLDPSYAHPWNGKGNVLADLCQLDEALEAYDRCSRLDPKMAAPWTGKGSVFLQLGKTDLAIEAYEKSIRLDPGRSNPWNCMAVALWKLGKIKEASELYMKAMKQFPGDTMLGLSYSELLIVMGKFVEARKSIRKLTKSSLSQVERCILDIMTITLSLITKDHLRTKAMAGEFIKKFDKSIVLQWDYSDIMPALSKLSPIDLDRIRALHDLSLGRGRSIDAIKELWDI